MFPLFNALLLPFYPVLGLYTLYRRFVQKKSLESLAGQWGHVSPEMRAFGRSPHSKIWIHAVSVGETMAAKPILAAIRSEIPEARIVLSSTTDAGHELARTFLKNGEIDFSFGFPLDLPVVLVPVLNALRPNAIGFVETELWPNLLALAHRRHIPTLLLNGRVSDNLLQTAPKLGPLWEWMSGNVTEFLMRGESDAARLRQLGVSDEKIQVMGDVKLEAPSVEPSSSRQMWRDRLGLATEPLIVAGSTHEGEEQLLLNTYKKLLQSAPHTRLALAPRHIDRVSTVVSQIEEAGFHVARRSQNERLEANSVYILDAVGELADFYATGDVAFVGGTLIPRGGHNLLEPVLRGVPVVFGGSVDNFRAVADLVISNNLGEQTSTENLASTFQHWLLHPDSHFAARVEAILSPHRGAAKRMAQAIVSQLKTS